MISNDTSSLHTALQRAIDLYHAGRIADGLKVMRQLSRTNPLSPKVWGYLGFLCHESDDFRAAATAFARAVELSPHSEKASMGLFFALWRLGKRADALKEMGRFVTGFGTTGYLNIMLPRPAARPHQVPRRRIRAIA